MIRCTIALLATCVLASSVNADIFFIDLRDSDDQFSVTGTIDVNIVTDIVNSSDLSFTHVGGSSSSLPSVPIDNGGVDFVVDAGMLFIADESGVSGHYLWENTNLGGEHFEFGLFRSATGAEGWQIEGENLQNVLGGRVLETFNPGGPVKIGVAVPEPSSFLFLSLVAAAGVAWRRRTQYRSCLD